jgi:aryl-alcohol dehydrogenase-like predicted oxidoreductase
VRVRQFRKRTLGKGCSDETTVAQIDAVQAEYSAFETLHETDGLIDTAKELGVAYVAYSPLGHGWLVDDFKYNTPEDFAPNDFRRSCKSPQPVPQFLTLNPTR